MFSLLNCQAWLLHIHLWTAINADSSKKNYKKLQKRAWVSVFHLVRYTSLRFKNTNDERYSQRDNLVLQVGKTRILPWHQLSWPEPSSYIRWGILKKNTRFYLNYRLKRYWAKKDCSRYSKSESSCDDLNRIWPNHHYPWHAHENLHLRHPSAGGSRGSTNFRRPHVPGPSTTTTIIFK